MKRYVIVDKVTGGTPIYCFYSYNAAYKWVKEEYKKRNAIITDNLLYAEDDKVIIDFTIIYPGEEYNYYGPSKYKIEVYD